MVNQAILQQGTPGAVELPEVHVESVPFFVEWWFSGEAEMTEFWGGPQIGDANAVPSSAALHPKEFEVPTRIGPTEDHLTSKPPG